MRRSACWTLFLMLASVAVRVITRPPKTSSRYWRRLWFTSRMVTWAPIPRAILAALVPTVPPPRITTLAGATPGTPRGGPPAPLGLLQELGPHLGGHPPRHLAHGDEEGEGAVGKLDGLVGDARDPATEHGLGEAAVRGQVKVGEEDEALPQEAVLLG